jgi:phosphatidylglycerol:prolipoprotein diacylglycerol transferase
MVKQFVKGLAIAAIAAILIYVFAALLPEVFSGAKTLNPILITVFGIKIKWYGFLIATAILIGYLLSLDEMQKNKIDSSLAESIVLVAVFGGVIGARLGFVIQNLNFYFHNVAEIFRVWDGGLSIHGALLGGTLALYLYSRFAKNKFIDVANSIAPIVLLSGAIGRFGNFFNQEIIGKPTNVPWKMFIDPFNRPAGYENFSFFHPVFLYESLLLIAAFIFYWLLKKKLRHFALSYTLIIYSLIRIAVEPFRIDYKPIFLKLDLAQLVSSGIIIFGMIIYFYQRRTNGKS